MRADVAPARAYAGPFRALVAEGTTRAGGIVATSRHRFTAAAIESRWSLAGRLPAGARAEALFPTWGRAARAVARLRDGRSVRLGRTPVALRRIVAIDVTGDRGAGYRIAPLARPAAATVALAPTRPQPAAPTPGPTVAVRFGGRTPNPAFEARITVRG